MTFQKRLQAVLRGGNLTVADLARWFHRPDPTVRGWVNNGGEPGGAPLDVKEVYAGLIILEQLIRRSKKLPLPRLAPSERLQQLAKIKRSARL